MTTRQIEFALGFLIGMVVGIISLLIIAGLLSLL